MFFNAKLGTCLLYALLNFVTWCALTVSSVLCLRTRWPIRHVYCMVSSHPHGCCNTAARGEIKCNTTRMILPSVKVLVTELLMGGFCKLVKNIPVQHVYVILLQHILKQGPCGQIQLWILRGMFEWETHMGVLVSYCTWINIISEVVSSPLAPLFIERQHYCLVTKNKAEQTNETNNIYVTQSH